MRYRAILITVTLFVLMSCIPDPLLVDEIPQLKSKIAVSTQMTGDQSVLILLTRSVGALDASDDSDIEELLNQIAINDAQVVIYNDSFADTLTFTGNGLYTSTTIDFIDDAEYKLSVESPTMGSVTSVTRVKSRVTFESIEGNIYDTGYDTLAEIRYSFNDPAGRNFYMINVQRITSEIEPADFLNPRIFTSLMQDATFDQQIYSEELKVFGGRDFVPGDTISVFLSNISAEYYDFMEARLDARYNFADFLGEPANYPTNVVGGLGYFNLYIPDVRILILDE
ncbi:MAG TPA: DUF4249 domain-containing protein [Cyclobacteriaceae bacterium]|nr:DUF4249 domain-containing protein [Cyclobacteriaceae bacterium]